jgi:hypothetical protein
MEDAEASSNKPYGNPCAVGLIRTYPRRRNQWLKRDTQKAALKQQVLLPDEIAHHFEKKTLNDTILFEFQLQRGRLLLFLFTPILHRTTDRTGMLSIEGLSNCRRDISILYVGNYHSHPGAGLENGPMPACELKKRQEGKSYGETIAHNWIDLRRPSESGKRKMETFKNSG